MNAKGGLRSFQGGFCALFGNTSYGFLVPFFDGVTYSVKIVRIDCGTFNRTTSDNWEMEFRNNPDPGTMQIVDLTLVDDELRGFIGGVQLQGPRVLQPVLQRQGVHQQGREGSHQKASTSRPSKFST